MLVRAVQSYLSLRRAAGFSLTKVGFHLKCFAAYSDAKGQRYVNSQTAIGLFLTSLEEAFDSSKLRFFSSLEALRDRQAFNRHLDPVRNVKWVVYAKPPFAGPQQVVDYVGRYTHRLAISNPRIVDIEGGEVSSQGCQH
jgi:hypothetical protein